MVILRHAHAIKTSGAKLDMDNPLALQIRAHISWPCQPCACAKMTVRAIRLLKIDSLPRA